MISIKSVLDMVYENSLSVTLFAVFLVLIQYSLKSYLSRKRLPPGPIGLPIVGYSPFLGKLAHRAIAKLGRKYGNVFTIQIGVNKVVILNDFRAAKEGLSKDSLLGRSINGIIFKFLIGESSVGDDSGLLWTEHRHSSYKILRDLGFGRGRMEDVVSDEINHLIQFIDERIGKATDIQSLLCTSIANNVNQFILGYRLEYGEPKAEQMNKFFYLFAESVSQTGLLLNSPTWLLWLFIKIFKALNGTVIVETLIFLKSEISKHQKNFNRNKIRDYMDGYLAQMEIEMNKDPNTSFTLDKLLANSLSIISAGSETTYTICYWALLIAVKYPHYQNKVQNEIDEVIGSERIMTWADRLRLPYTQAFINEVLRFKTSVPLNLYRRAVEDTHVLNHFISKDTLVLVNFWAVHNDPKLWTDPEQFDPNHFLTEDGQQLVNTEYLIPFSSGKRSCFGESLARLEVFLYLATILQRYRVSAPNGHVISLDEKLGISLHPREKLFLVFNKR